MLSAPAPATRLPTVRVGDHDLAYRRAGAGEPVLLVHGVTTHSFLWDGVVRGLLARGGLDLVAVDLLGCGQSDKRLGTSYSLSAQADLLVRFCAALGLERVHLVGHDLGGGIAQIMAVRAPGLLRTLSLVNCVGHDFWPVQPIIALRTPVVRQIMLAALDAGAFTLLVRRGLHHKALATPALMAEFLSPLATPEGRKAFVHFARCLDNADLTSIADDLRRLRVPTLLAWGMGDAYLSFAIAERLAAEIPGARLERLDTAGHFSPIDEPERLAELLAGHFDDQRR